jgi:DNA-binding response OmpR family regulator
MGYCILVVDDEPDLCEATCELLQVAGFEAEGQTDPQEALATFASKRQKIDVVLLDWTLPGTSGVEVLAALRAADATVRVIVASGHPVAQVKAELRGQVPQGYLQKPYAYRELLDALNAVIASA